MHTQEYKIYNDIRKSQLNILTAMKTRINIYERIVIHVSYCGNRLRSARKVCSCLRKLAIFVALTPKDSSCLFISVI